MEDLFNVQPTAYSDFYSTVANVIDIQPKYLVNKPLDKPRGDTWKV